MREYSIFIERLLASKQIGEKLKNDIMKIEMPNQSDLKTSGNSFSDAIVSQIPIFNKLIPATKLQIKIDKMTKIYEGFSQILFNIEEYKFR